MIPVALLLWRVVLKPMIDWWKGVAPSKKAVKVLGAKEGPSSDRDQEQPTSSPSPAPGNQSNVR